jgi:hypothetical protein
MALSIRPALETGGELLLRDTDSMLAVVTDSPTLPVILFTKQLFRHCW